ncbi:Glycosyltransferase [Candidatus Methylobacter favarea]|uniref:Glycosyltransferase n=1 Tax=Candidatus Methylobacter favarea TaxID=2707345 RepID=A0A8S0XEA4_9GAMM|nr:glycosyltransferase family 4 protein [Candidatus Methylobacter favarea]CAA9889562.1 Glycosyltransferase [Candidatus Methylobacter favarea]
MKVALINHSDIDGGAARATYRIHHALRRHDVDSTMMVNSAAAGDWTVRGPTTKWEKVVVNVRRPLGGLLNKMLHTGNPVLHSPAIFSSRWPARLNALNADLLHIHWITGEMLSISDVGELKKPLVWTLHDMWAFCGAEHYTEDFRWREGYLPSNRPNYESGFDLNRWTWQRKRKNWKQPLHIVTPSRWLADCVRQSALMREWPVSVIPNAIDTDAWQPVDKTIARQMLHLPPAAPLLLFGAMGGAKDPRKGFDLLKSALDHLRGQMPGLELVVFGQLAPETSVDLGFPVHYAGHLHDDLSLRLLYAAADVMVVPSRQEAFGQTASEAHACGTPVIAFDTCGLPDIVTHKKTGWLAKVFDTEDLAGGIQWILSDDIRHSKLRANARADAVFKFSYRTVAEQYLTLYEKIIRS